MAKYCFELSVDNFSNSYIDSIQFTEEQLLVKEEILKMIRIGYTSGIKISLDAGFEEITTIRKLKFKEKNNNYDELHRRIGGKQKWPNIKMLEESEFKSDRLANLFLNYFFPKTTSPRILLNFFCVGYWLGIMYINNKMRLILNGETKITIAGSSLENLLNEYNNYLKKYDLKVLDEKDKNK